MKNTDVIYCAGFWAMLFGGQIAMAAGFVLDRSADLRRSAWPRMRFGDKMLTEVVGSGLVVGPGTLLSVLSVEPLSAIPFFAAGWLAISGDWDRAAVWWASGTLWRIAWDRACAPDGTDAWPRILVKIVWTTCSGLYYAAACYVWCGVVVVVLAGYGLVVADRTPPHSTR
jgi:hypothetical protein